MPQHPAPPYHGGRAIDLCATRERADELKASSRQWPSWTLSDVQLADLELMATGAYAPVTGFMTEQEQASIVVDGHLPDGTLWPVPITLDVDTATANALPKDEGSLALRDAEGTLLAVLHVRSRWRADQRAEAQRFLGSDDPVHPEVAALISRTGSMRLGGPVEVVSLPVHHDLTDLRATPGQLRSRLERHGDRAVLAVHLRGVVTRGQLDAIRQAAADLDAVVLLHATVGPGERVDLDRFTRARVLELAAGHLRPDLEVETAVVELPVRLSGPREAVLHAIVRQNHGATHLLVGPWHASPHTSERVAPLFGPNAPAQYAAAASDELDIGITALYDGTRVKSSERVNPVTEVPYGVEARDPGQQLLQAVHSGQGPLVEIDIPEDVAEEIRRTHPPRGDRGFCVFLTGLSGSGKSTVAQVLEARLLQRGERTVTLLDGDLVRRHLSSELGFSKQDRDTNVRRIGYVASEIAKHGGIAICAPIAPYDAIRKANRRQIEERGGGYVLVHVATPLEVCEARDRKGLYARARAGEITGFTGIDDPYEVPDDAALTIDTTDLTPETAAERILAHLESEGWLPPRP